MSECYLCGAYVKRGEGFRRQVETGTSTRIYIGSRKGASFGAAQGEEPYVRNARRPLTEPPIGLSVSPLCSFWLMTERASTM